MYKLTFEVVHTKMYNEFNFYLAQLLEVMLSQSVSYCSPCRLRKKLGAYALVQSWLQQPNIKHKWKKIRPYSRYK